MNRIDLTPFIREDKGSEIVVDLPCKMTERAFFNGYQTWTPSYEVTPTDTHIGIKRLFRRLGAPWGTTKYGDVFFMNYSGKPGRFHGFTYFYKRTEDNYLLIGSTDETNGYTIFDYDMPEGVLRIKKDAGSAKFDQGLHIAAFEGSHDEVFDAWFEAAGIKLEGRIMILGCGGVARTMAYEIALRNKPFEFAVRRQSVGKAGLLCLDITRKIPDAQVSFGLIDQIIGTVDVLINATPVGMYPNVDDQPIHNCAIGRCGAVYDAIYNPYETALVKRAKANGSKAEGGMSMLVYQAAAAHKIWDGSEYDSRDIEQLCRDAAEAMLNK